MRRIKLTNGGVTLVDTSDYRALAMHSWFGWSVRRSRYARRDVGRTAILMHRDIMGFPEGLLVDHEDGDGLNNQRYNLRTATHSQNERNRRHLWAGKTSRFLGVSKHSTYADGATRWMAQLTDGPRHVYLGVYRDEEEAARAYDEAASVIHGAFAAPNFPKEQSSG